MAPIVVITGPTASGKTGLALELAKKYNGEIICADSRTIYQGMNIGTAKPTAIERATVPHHGLDLVEPGGRFTAHDFQRIANETIRDIRKRGRVPFLVGGTGLYIDAVVREYQWPDAVADPASFASNSVDELRMMIKNQHLSLPVNNANRRHLINTLVRGAHTGKALEAPRTNTIVVAIATEKAVLEGRIRTRAHEMFTHGVIEETEHLARLYGWDSEAMSSNIYPIIHQMLEGVITKTQAVERFIVRDRQLAKRQLTWLRRHKYVTWLPLDEAGPYIETRLREMC